MPVPGRLLITALLIAALVCLSAVPARPTGNLLSRLAATTPVGAQKLMHVVLYCALTLLLSWTLQPLRGQVVGIALASVIAVGFGSLMEWVQSRVPTRVGSGRDVLLNTLGAFFGALLALVLLR